MTYMYIENKHLNKLTLNTSLKVKLMVNLKFSYDF